MKRVLLWIVLLCPTTAMAGDFLDTRLTFSIADDDILKGPTESATGSRTIPSFSANNNNALFFDNFERRDVGFENLSHLVLYTNQPGFFAGLDTEAALVLRATVLASGDVRLRDDGSYIRLSGPLGNGKWSVTAFPISANRFQLGYSFDISWGGNRIFQNVRAAPGLKLQWENDFAYAFLGAKTAFGQILQDDATLETDTVYGVLAGGGFDVLDELRIEANGGYFRRGIINKPELQVTDGNRIQTAPWDAVGGSVQVSYHVGMPIGTPIDFRLYRNDPLRQQTFYKPEEYNEGVSFLLAAEASVLGQTLQDPDAPATTVIQPAVAADLTFRMKINKFRIHALAVYRDLAFMLFNVPSAPPFSDFPDGIETNPEFFFSGGFDYFFEKLRLTPGLILGVQMPAHTVNNGVVNAEGVESQRTFVYRSEDQIDILDFDESVQPIFASKITFKWDLSTALAAMGEFQASYDPNRRVVSQDDLGVISFKPSDPVILGFTLLLRARF